MIRALFLERLLFQKSEPSSLVQWLDEISTRSTSHSSSLERAWSHTLFCWWGRSEEGSLLTERLSCLLWLGTTSGWEAGVSALLAQCPPQALSGTETTMMALDDSMWVWAGLLASNILSVLLVLKSRIVFWNYPKESPVGGKDGRCGWMQLHRHRNIDFGDLLEIRNHVASLQWLFRENKKRGNTVFRTPLPAASWLLQHLSGTHH